MNKSSPRKTSENRLGDSLISACPSLRRFRLGWEESPVELPFGSKTPSFDVNGLADADKTFAVGPDDDFEEEDDLADCMMGPDGYCGLAGTEYCDWDCPLSLPRLSPCVDGEGW